MPIGIFLAANHHYVADDSAARETELVASWCPFKPKAICPGFIVYFAAMVFLKKNR
jgi:hypothetical protein